MLLNVEPRKDVGSFKAKVFALQAKPIFSNLKIGYSNYNEDSVRSFFNGFLTLGLLTSFKSKKNKYGCLRKVWTQLSTISEGKNGNRINKNNV